MTSTIAFIGAGNMGRAILGGLRAGGHPAARLRAADADAAARARVAQELGIFTDADNRRVAAGAEVLVLAVKPQQMREVALALAEITAATQPLVLSIAAGIPTAALAAWLGATAPIVRAMPNTPALIGRGTSVLYATAATDAARRATAESILRAVGAVHWLADESLMDAVTALSGSGPAYVFRLLESLAAAGAALGLAPELAQRLALETTAGAAELALVSPQDPATLRRQVTSKGGTTERALAVLDEAGIDALFARALSAARDRSRTLSEEFGKS
ncbi:MAG TPA: pyrroline-5-carboxylate reductase [Gammaproteobacteria bacterium]|nr:pyrroline-5-carboxylate reductase [Gammaproteobacteria bacterium]